MIPASLTKGMSTIEVLIVFLAAHASKRELVRLKQFFEGYEK
jgi:hypothetical protein